MLSTGRQYALRDIVVAAQDAPRTYSEKTLRYHD